MAYRPDRITRGTLRGTFPLPQQTESHVDVIVSMEELSFPATSGGEGGVPTELQKDSDRMGRHASKGLR